MKSLKLTAGLTMGLLLAFPSCRNGNNPVAAPSTVLVSYVNPLMETDSDCDVVTEITPTERSACFRFTFADYCIYKLGKALEKPEAEIELFARRAMNCKNLFDPEFKIMRGKNRNGTFQSPFNPFKWGDAFTEGNSRENRFVYSVRLNGKNYGKNYLKHPELVKGAKIDFDITGSPNKERATTAASYPNSFSCEQINQIQIFRKYI